MLDIHTDYLICSFRQASATRLARLLDHEIAHDSVTRFLSSEPSNKMMAGSAWYALGFR